MKRLFHPARGWAETEGRGRFMPVRSWIATVSRWNPRWHRLFAGSLLWWLLLWAAWAVRLCHLEASDLTFDEAATYFVANRPLFDILAYLRQAVREHPPVYYLLIRPWMTLAGTSEFSLRFFAVGASLVGIALTARMARILARQLNIKGRVEVIVFSFLPALVLALFPFEVYYARDARMYTLTIVWATLSSLQFLPLLFDQEPRTGAKLSVGLAHKPGWPSSSALVKLVLINALALFTHYYLALLIATQFVSLLLLRRWRALVAWSATHGLVGLTGLIWILRSHGLASSLAEAWGRFDPVWPTASQLRRLLADLLFGPIRGVPWNLVYGWGALIALGLLVAWVRPSRALRGVSEDQPKMQGAKAIGVWLIITLLVPIAAAYIMPEPPRSRYLIFGLPFAALAVGQIPFGFATRKRTVLVWLGLSALSISILGMYGLPRTVNWIKSTYGRTIKTVSARARPGDGVLFYGPWQAISYHYYRANGFPAITSLPPQAPPQLVPEEAEPVLRELLSTYQRLWVIPAAVDNVDPAHFVEGWLKTHSHPVWTTRDASLFLPPSEQEAFSLPIQLEFGDGLRLERVSGDAQAVPAGESLRLTLTWMVSDSLDGDVQLDLSLVDEQHIIWRQWHSIPGQWSNPPSTWKAGDVVTDRLGVIVPQGAPPGRFAVQLAVLDKDSGALLRPSDSEGPFPQPRVDLFTFEVTEPFAQPVLVDVGAFVGPFTFTSPEEVNSRLTLAGYELGGLRFQQGHPVPLRLHWLAPAEPVPNVELRLQLRHRSKLSLIGGQVTSIVTHTLPLSPGYPVTDWPSGRLVSLPTALDIPIEAIPGDADLTLAVLGPDGVPWAVDGDPRLTLTKLTIEERSMLRRLPKDLTAVQVDFDGGGDQIALRGYRIDGDPVPGGHLDLTYAWSALTQPNRIYSVFNHLLTADGTKIAQVDGWPQSGKVLTTQWRPSEYIRDTHKLELPIDAPPGPYLLAVGLYDAASGDRLNASYAAQDLPNDQWLATIAGSR